MTLNLEIVTPEKVVFKDEVNEVVVPTTSGEIAILPNHISLLSQIAPGEMTIKKGGTQDSLAITGGFLDVHNNNVSILADYAIRSEDIEIAKVEEAQKRAEKVMQEKASDQDFALAEAQFRRTILELKVASKRRRKI
ncbi:MAG: ATP synthase F1 subunit epsilon [Candidatus Levybacteria bacterium]|nr:ATP synthase F1 subunit epsilon [Candidatus Levybacteria bacterium]